MKKIILVILVLYSFTFAFGEEQADSLKVNKPLVTFKEFGSTTCVPCKMMEKVMEEVKDIYTEKIDIQFIDVTKDRNAAKEYGIKLIPTQVFYDSSGEEFFRHQGYFPTAEIQKVIEPYITTPALRE